MVHPDAAVAGLAARPLGLADLDSWQWRTRPGHPAFRTARKAEGRGDWAGVAAACKQALAADPTNLEAAWLYAVALAKTGDLAGITAPLALAGAGDFGKWAIASLEQPALQPYLATPAGQAWAARVAADKPPYLDALAHGVLVIAKGDIYAVHAQRWYRLTRTFGAVHMGYLSTDGHHLAYVTRGKTSHKLAVGSIDLATGLTTRAQDLPPIATQIASTKDGFWIGQAGMKRLLTFEGERQGLLAPTKIAARPSGAWLEIYSSSGARLHRGALANISADWDDQGLASAVRIATSNRVVTVPGQIQGDTLAWSPDKNHVAFVAQISDHCDGGPTVAAFVVDAATGAVSELARGHGLALDWAGDRTIALASDDGVTLRDLGGATTPLTGATNLTRPRYAPHCEVLPTEPTVEPDDEPADEPTKTPAKN